ncbi:hypothetical protein PI124_g15476 [Phytophthora idaei]|nr:hypothetical protein PI124_g15476 [Phytophthora idaei]
MKNVLDPKEAGGGGAYGIWTRSAAVDDVTAATATWPVRVATVSSGWLTCMYTIVKQDTNVYVYVLDLTDSSTVQDSDDNDEYNAMDSDGER